MRSVYIRPLNFIYGSDAKYQIKKKLALPLCGINEIAFSNIEIINKKNKQKKIISVSHISRLHKSDRNQVLKDLNNIKKKKRIDFQFKFIKTSDYGSLKYNPR